MTGQKDSSIHIRNEVLEHSQDPVLLASVHQNLGKDWLDIGNIDKAKLHCNKAYEIRINSLPPDHEHLGYSNMLFGRISKQEGCDLEALEHWDEALRIFNIHFSDGHPKIKELQGLTSEIRTS